MARFGLVMSTAVFLLGLISLLVTALQGPAYRMGWWTLQATFRSAFPVAFVLGCIAVGAGIITVIVRFRHRFPGLVLLIIGMLAGIAGASVPFGMRQLAQAVPVIHDITTDTVEPPGFIAIAPLRADSPNPVGYAGELVAELQREAYPDLQTIRLRYPYDRVFQTALEVVEELKWELQASEPGEGRIEATEKTIWFGFSDDVSIRIRAGETVTDLDIRSKSRVGQSDLGVNAKRIRTFRSRLLQKLN